MSIRVMTLIWDTCLYDGNTLNVLLAMADWASDDGGDIFPGIETLAGKCRCAVRTTQSALRRLEADNVLEQIANSKGGRGKVTEYKINLERVQELQGLHEADDPFCSHCISRRKSQEKRVQFRAQRVQASTTKGASSRQKGADPRNPIDNIHHQPPENHHHSLAPAGADESEKFASLSEGTPERWPEFRSAVAQTWPNGFPADNEVACKVEFIRQTRQHPAEIVIACAREHGAELRRRDDARGKRAGGTIAKKPSNWLKEGDWQGYIPKAEATRIQEAETVTALGNVQRALGSGLFELLRRSMSDSALAALNGLTLEAPATFAITSGVQRILLQKHEGALERHLGDRPRYILVQKAGAA